jgi:hypothetical protein
MNTGMNLRSMASRSLLLSLLWDPKKEDMWKHCMRWRDSVITCNEMQG